MEIAKNYPKKGTKTGLSLFRLYIKHWDLMLMFLPCILYFIIFCYVPMVGAVIAFKSYRAVDGIFGSHWVGFANFKTLFSGQEFPHVLRNTLVLSGLRIIVGFPAPIILALLLNEVKEKWYKRTIQTLTYLPYFFSWVVLGGIVVMIFSQNGPANQVLKLIGLQPVEFMTKSVPYIVTLLLTGIWHGIGYGAVIYLAALAGIDMEIYEAALVDGANRFQRVIHITIPCLMSTAAIMLVLNLGGILNAGFDQIYNTYNPMVYEVADIIDTYVLRRLQQMDFSLGTASGLFKSVVGTVLILTANWIVKKISDDEYGMW
jgi:putative aldouronate transport system permease protein